MIINEPFVAGFTGALATYVTSNGRRITFTKPYPRIVKGDPYMMRIDTETNSIRMIPVNPRVA